jgi:1-acyl-sn-glycerol-3-phosphate acyltransferase
MRTLLTLGFWIVATPLAALFVIPYALLTGNSDPLYRVAMWIVRTGIWLSGVRVTVTGRERLVRKQTYIFMANHVSNLDPPLLVPLLPKRTSVLVKKELFRIPVLGIAMRVARLVPVDRHNRDAAIQSVRDATEVIRSGLDMTIFPEGTRSPDGRLLPFKKGPFYLAMESGCPVAPVTILGTQQILPKGSFFLRRGRAEVMFHEPLWPKDFADRESLIEATRAAIESSLPKTSVVDRRS